MRAVLLVGLACLAALAASACSRGGSLHARLAEAGQADGSGAEPRDAARESTSRADARPADARPRDGGHDGSRGDAGRRADASAGDAASNDGAADGGSDATAVDSGPAALHVLFIGDSYTAVNDLPGMLTRIAATAGAPPTITTDEVVMGGATLEVQWDNGLAQPKIAERQWTHVVLQGQSEEPLPQFGVESSFFRYAQQFGDLIVDAGARPTLFVTWAKAAGDPDFYGPPEYLFLGPGEMQDELTSAYAQVAGAFPGSVLACAGEAFRRSNARYPGIALQQSDHSHPTVAGTYLAAATFYVALTGKPVPPASAVPAGLPASDAAKLRSIALVGSDCADVRFKAVVTSSLGADPDGGTPFDFGTAGLPIALQITLMNSGGGPASLRDGMTLSGPFVWTAGGAYPGGSGPGFCGGSLAAGSSCVMSVTYTAAASARSRLTLDVTGAYLPTVTRAIEGEETERALLSVSDSVGFFGCTDSCGPYTISTLGGLSVPFYLFVLNRGARPVTAFGQGAALAAPFSFTGGAFPGGVGSAVIGSPGVSYPFCSAATLGVGEQCVVSVTFAPPGVGTFPGAVNLTYSDARGKVSPNANRDLSGSVSDLPP